MHSVGNMYNFRVLGLAIRVSTDRGLKLPKTKQNNKMKNFEAQVAAKCQSSINGTSDVMPTFFINPALTQKSLHRCQFKVVACMHRERKLWLVAVRMKHSTATTQLRCSNMIHSGKIDTKVKMSINTA
jgi:hypothetical protein